MNSINDEKYDDNLGIQKMNWEREYKILAQTLENVIDFQHWNFHQSFASFEDKTPPYVIYDSEWCRVWFSWKGGDLHQPPEMSVFYGRLHAPNDGGFVILEGENYRTWHHVTEPLYFLDGLSGKEAADKWLLKHRLPFVIEEFKQSESGKKLLPGGYQTIEGVAHLHLTIWRHYGTPLFELFDSRKQDLWSKYTNFLKEYYLYQDEQNKNKGISPSSVKPPLYKVC